LGLEWHPGGDYFCCALHLDTSPVLTKRGILSLVARIFDPLGFFGPAVFMAKTVMQRTWRQELSWDEPLPSDICDEWVAFVSDFASLKHIKVPHYINSSQNAPCCLQGFCDSSLHGYSTVAYVRMRDAPAHQSVFLIGTKTKLAPLKSLTVPRLELNATLLLARWLGSLRRILESQLNIVGVHAWSDSMIVLSWLTVPHESVKVYISNRVHQKLCKLRFLFNIWYLHKIYKLVIHSYLQPTIYFCISTFELAMLLYSMYLNILIYYRYTYLVIQLLYTI